MGRVENRLSEDVVVSSFNRACLILLTGSAQSDHECFQELVQPEQVQICRDKKYFQMGPNPLSPIALRAVV